MDEREIVLLKRIKAFNYGAKAALREGDLETTAELVELTGQILSTLQGTPLPGPAPVSEKTGSATGPALSVKHKRKYKKHKRQAESEDDDHELENKILRGERYGTSTSG